MNGNWNSLFVTNLDFNGVSPKGWCIGEQFLWAIGWNWLVESRRTLFWKIKVGQSDTSLHVLTWIRMIVMWYSNSENKTIETLSTIEHHISFWQHIFVRHFAFVTNLRSVFWISMVLDKYDVVWKANGKHGGIGYAVQNFRMTCMYHVNNQDWTK